MINKIILGTVQMGIPYGINNKYGQILPNDSIEILNTAFIEGIRTLDTAEGYGSAHKIIGDYHASNSKAIFKIITKIPPIENLDKIENKVNLYLNTLKVTQLEGLLFHTFQSYIKHKKRISKLVKLKEEGLIKELGVSIYSNEELNELLDDEDITLIQLPFNLLDNLSFRGELLQKAKIKGKTINTRSVFLQGLFFKDPFENNPIVIALNRELLKIQEISNKYKISISALAISYCLNQSIIDQVIIGVDSVKQLKNNIEYCKFQINDEIIEQINKIKISDINLINPSKWN